MLESVLLHLCLVETAMPSRRVDALASIENGVLSEGSSSDSEPDVRAQPVLPEPVPEPRVAQPGVQLGSQTEVPPAAQLPSLEMYRRFIAAWMEGARGQLQSQVQTPMVAGPEIRTVVGTAIPRGYSALYTVAVRSEQAMSSQRVSRVQRRRRSVVRVPTWSRPGQRVIARWSGPMQHPPEIVYTLTAMPQNQHVHTGQAGSRWCRNCSSIHPPPCRQPVRCYSCGRIGHLFRRCPRNGASAPRPQFVARPRAEVLVRPQSDGRRTVDPRTGMVHLMFSRYCMIIIHGGYSHWGFQIAELCCEYFEFLEAFI